MGSKFISGQFVKKMGDGMHGIMCFIMHFQANPWVIKMDSYTLMPSMWPPPVTTTFSRHVKLYIRNASDGVQSDE